MDKITIIIPVYKVENYLHRCVDSVLAQTFQDFEIILVDDGSPDNCGKICDEYAKKDGRIHVIHKENGGLSDARNAGLDWMYQNSDSEWIAFIDSDDWIHPCYLQLLYEAVTEGKTKISVCKETHVHSAEEVSKIDSNYSWSVVDTEQAYDTHNMITAWCKLFHRKLFEKIRFPVGKLHEDSFTIYKVVLVQDRVSVSPQAYYFYYVNPNSLTHVEWKPKRLLDQIEACEQFLSYLKDNHRNALYVKNIKLYMQCIALEHLRVISDKPEYKKYSRQLTVKMRRAFRIYRKYCPVSFKGNEWMYIYSYPKTFRFLLGIKSLLDKINRKG